MTRKSFEYSSSIPCAGTLTTMFSRLSRQAAEELYWRQILLRRPLHSLRWFTLWILEKSVTVSLTLPRSQEVCHMNGSVKQVRYNDADGLGGCGTAITMPSSRRRGLIPYDP